MTPEAQAATKLAAFVIAAAAAAIIAVTAPAAFAGNAGADKSGAASPRPQTLRAAADQPVQTQFEIQLATSALQNAETAQ